MGAMGATQDVPGPRPAERVEIVHESAHTRITRLLVSGRPVVRKEPLGPDAERRLRREAGILERVRGVDGVAQLVDGPRYPDSVVLADAGTTTLAGLATPLAVDELIGVAVGLARAVAGMHRCGVLHRDITPANVVVSGDGAPCLVDFALATSVAELRPGFTHYREIVGTLAYLAPESTGRTGRPVDQRADLYALGATLYEAATGAPPFGTVDPLTLIHDHLARVPVPPAEQNTALPAVLSEIILHLLEKEPDRRYQSADGLLFDLERLRDADAQAAAELRIGARDLPLRLLPPSRLVGREADVVALDEAFQKALVGRCRAVLVGGAPGVGKTALVDQLRSVVTGGDGWFVAGKFDQYRRDLDFDGVHQASRALGRLLLAEPEGELAGVRERLLRALGPNAGLAAAALPEFATLLAVPPDAGDPLTAQVRAQRTAVEILRAVASRKRPLVFFVDDLQWAGRTPLGVFDLLLSEEPIEGLLLVGAYREDDVSTTHPLAPTLSRWRYEAGVQQLRLENLPAPALADLVAEMLHVGPAAAHNLAGVIGPHTSGNPYVTVELLDALRRGGLLTATVDGWRWDDAAVRARLGDSEEASFVQARVSALPAAARQVVEAMACLSGRAEAGLLQTAIGQPAAVVEQAVAPALEDGLLVTEPGVHSAVRFRHDRLREAILRGLDPSRRRPLQLGMARRLAGVPELFALAAEQYLPVVDAVTDSQERQEVVGLLRRAADQAAVIGDQARMSTLLAAALGLVDPGDTITLIELRTGNHAALFGLGRLDEADDDYRTIEALCPAVIDRLDATALQVRSLTHRTRLADATALGLDALRELGITVPAADRLPAELEHQFAHLYRWVDHSADEDAARPEITDPRLLAATRLMNAVLPAAQVDLALLAWLSLEGLRILLDHGSGRTLLGPASHAGIVAVVLRGDYGAGYRAVQRVVALGEARGYEPDTSQARLLFAHSCCWFEPIEQGVEAARRAREGLIAGGELTNAGYTYSATMMYLIDCAPSLDVYAAEAESGLAFARRTSDELIRQVLEPDLWLAGVLRGETSAAAGEAMLARYTDNPAALLFGHIRCAIAASIFDDSDSLARHAAAAMPLLPATLGHYPTAIARVLRGLALAGQARTTDSDQRGALLAELDEQIDWLASRAVDAPDNFAHLLRLLEAERAWATGDSWAAVLAFDAARREAAARPRPWHRALITERAARFHLTHGLDGTGHELLAHARDQYAAWGATAKVAQLGWAQPSLQSAAGPTARGDAAPDRTAPHQRATVAAGTVDLLGILAASQALSSQTRLDRLHARVVEVLGALTGATAVHLVIWDEDRRDWLLPTQDGGAGPVGAGHEATVPLSVLRYVQRTGEPLVVADATSDDRFARDLYLTDVACCSLLAVPILSRGALRAVLLLENRLLRGAFTTNRLDAVTLVAGQLAVSLDNAQLYAQLTNSRARIVTAGDAARRRIQRNLHDGAQQRLVALALQLRTVQAEVPPEAGRLRARLGDLAAEANGALDELREIARGLHPAALARGGLPRALPSLARRCPVPVHLAVHIDGRLPDPIELAAYYTVAEALTNTAKHAHATAVDIGIHTDGDRLRIGVRDDGRGGADPHAGSGLLGLKDRIEALGGLFVVHSPPGSGTTLQIALPLDDPSRGEPSR